MPNLLFISNITGKKLGLGFLGSSMNAAKSLGYEFYSVANRAEATEQQMRADEEEYGIRLFHIDLARAPYSPKNFKAYKQLCKIIRDEKIDYIHCNTPTGGLLGRLAGKKCKVKKVLYQAHGFHFYKGAPKLNWLIYYPIEKWLAGYTDTLVTINKEDFAFANEKIRLRKNGKIHYVAGVGINVGEFRDVDVDRDEKRASLGLSSEDVVLISAGRLDANKNNETTIRALVNAPNVKLLLCGDGDKRKELTELAKQLGVSDRVHFLGNRTDIKELYKISDIFVMMSFREGLSRSIMEAMASGMPCVVSNIRGNVDLVEGGKGGFLVSPKNAEELSTVLNKLANDACLRNEMSDYNKERIMDYDISVVEDSMRKIYNESFND